MDQSTLAEILGVEKDIRAQLGAERAQGGRWLEDARREIERDHESRRAQLQAEFQQRREAALLAAQERASARVKHSRGRRLAAGAHQRRRSAAARPAPSLHPPAGGGAVIIRMSKVEVAGPRDLLLPALETIERLGVLQIDAKLREGAEEGVERGIRPLALDGRTLAERLFLEDLKIKIEFPGREGKRHWSWNPAPLHASRRYLSLGWNARRMKSWEKRIRKCERGVCSAPGPGIAEFSLTGPNPALGGGTAERGVQDAARSAITK